MRITLKKQVSSSWLLVTAVVVIMLLGLCSCRRQVTPRFSATGGQATGGRINLQEEPQSEDMSELTVPQLEEEKQPDYTFNKAENLFDVSLEDQDLRSTMQSMCDMLSLNLVMDPEVQDTLSLTLRDITFYKFLEVALEKTPYNYRVEDNFVYIEAPRLETRTFHLDYLNTARQVQGIMTITGQGGGASAGLLTQSNTTMQTQATMNVWADIQNGLEAIVLGQGKQETGALTARGSFGGYDDGTGHRLVLEPNSGTVQVTATPEVLEQAEQYLVALENSLQRQVLIEARFVEINLDNRHESGIDWSLVPDLTSLSDLSGSLTGGALVNQTLSPSSREFQIGVSNENVSAIMTAMSRHGNVNVLQSPQVSSLNNQPAVIRVARTETFFQRTETPGQPATATSAATQPVINYEPILQPTGVVLNLTPQISEDGVIIMSIRPSITTIASVATSPDGLSTSPITDVRELDTVAKVKHGQTIILAGLIQERELQTTKETPLLARLPLLGGLFKQVVKDRSKVELVILLTPYINFSRKPEQISEEQLPRYRELAKRYNLTKGEFTKQR
jgi:MSHA biogenesis protein MshL